MAGDEIAGPPRSSERERLQRSSVSNRSCHIIHDQVGENHVLKARSGAAAHFDRRTKGLSGQAIGNRDVLCDSAAIGEDRPASVKSTIRECHKPATAEQCAGVILADNITVADMHVFAVDEMESVVIVVHPVVNVETFHFYKARLDDPDRMNSPPE